MYYLDAQRGKDGSVIYRTKTNFRLPLARTRDGSWKIPDGTTVYVCLTSDFFLREADEWRDEAWEIMEKRPGVRFWLQTKRVSRVRDCLPDRFLERFPHVSLCVSAENEKRAAERVPLLLDLPFREKHVMCAPLLSGIDLSPYLKTGQISSVLADGENYEGARPCRAEWVQSLYEQCRENGTDFEFVGTGALFVKDGRTYRVKRAYRGVMARRSGWNNPPLSALPPVQKRCARCARADVCDGCTWCGRCEEKN